MPVSSTKLVVGTGLALLIVVWWARKQNQKSEQSEDEQAQQEGPFVSLASPGEIL